MNLAAIILADPPWEYNDRKETRRDNPSKAPKFGIGVERRYSAGTMSLGDLCAMGSDVANISHPDAYLLLWATCPRLEAAQTVMRFWGFPYVTVHSVWVKVYPNKFEGIANADDIPGAIFKGPGRYSPSNVELLLIGTRGKCWHPATGYKPRQVILEPHPRDPLTGKIRHSRKPEVFQDELDRWLRPHAPGHSLELFATRYRPGWTCLGHALSGADIRVELRGRAGQGSLFCEQQVEDSSSLQEVTP